MGTKGRSVRSSAGRGKGERRRVKVVGGEKRDHREDLSVTCPEGEDEPSPTSRRVRQVCRGGCTSSPIQALAHSPRAT